jgi:hypothetical protein
MSDHPTELGETVRPDFRHAVPVFAIVAVALAAALIVRAWLVPASFGETGFYRAAAAEEEQMQPTRHSGSAACAECHADIAALLAKDAHGSVACETCHGPGAAHAADADQPMLAATNRADCLVCHRRLDARPGFFPQVDPREHFRLVGVSDPDTPCVRCHSGHEPLFMDRDLRAARLHPLVHDCGDCHLGRTDETLPRPASHPQIFRCEYCHAGVAKSFADGSHAAIRCTTCHVFIRENSFSGRIVRDADPRFCLLCHRKTDFRSPQGPPGIEWPAHLREAAGEEPDPKRSCVECHQDQIHGVSRKEAPHG